MTEERSLLARVRSLLGSLGEGADLRQTLEAVLAAVSEASGCESVGLRWRAGDDYPYFLTRGFGLDFVIREGPLCDRDSAGIVLRHPDGTTQLACLCGAVIQGRTNPAYPCFTPNGSFWTNATTAMLRDSTPAAFGIRTRNYCNTAGYESVALIPLRTQDERRGLLQLNSRTPGRFTPERIALYEEVVAEIASAVADRVPEP
jgi:GAF domain-containing protein